MSCGAGYKVDQKYRVADIGPNDLPWARHHPHLSGGCRGDHNTVYDASTKLDLGSDDDRRGVAGWGVFPSFDLATGPDRPKRHWRVAVASATVVLSRRQQAAPDLPRQRPRSAGDTTPDHAYLRSVGRGQEFVLNLDHYPEAVGWLADLVNSLGSNMRGS